MPPPYTSDQELAWSTLASETAEAIYSGEFPGRAPQLDGVSGWGEFGVGGRGGGAYKTQTVKGVGVESPEKEAGRGLLIAVTIVSAIVNAVLDRGGGFCTAGRSLLLSRTVRGTSTFIDTCPCMYLSHRPPPESCS